MKQKYRKPNCPRIQTAITKVLTSNVGCWYQDARYIGEWIREIAYGADKYDVLNALCPGAQNKVITFARGDIRHRKRNSEIISLILMAVAVLLMLISLRLIQDC